MRVVRNYILDACALIAYLGFEEGKDVVDQLLERAEREEIIVSINAVNLIEVYYDRIRAVGSDEADATIREIRDTFPISIIEALNPAIVRESAYFKVAGKMSFADAILIGTARCTGATVVTCDHAEFEPVERHGQIPFLWIRP